MKLSALIFAAALAGCATSSLPATQRIDNDALDARIEALMAREQVVGMAVAIVDHGEITHVNAYGLRNRETRAAAANRYDHVRRVRHQGGVLVHGDAAG